MYLKTPFESHLAMLTPQALLVYSGPSVFQVPTFVGSTSHRLKILGKKFESHRVVWHYKESFFLKTENLKKKKHCLSSQSVSGSYCLIEACTNLWL